MKKFKSFLGEDKMSAKAIKVDDAIMELRLQIGLAELRLDKYFDFDLTDIKIRREMRKELAIIDKLNEKLRKLYAKI